VRVTNMRGANLNVFEFDYDLTWAAFFMNADEEIYGRYGGRDADSADKYLTLAGLKYALRAALATHRREWTARPEGPPKLIVTVEQSPAAQRMKSHACVHCHQVYDFRRADLQAAGKWRVDDVWTLLPPEPQSLGLTLDPEQGNRMTAVAFPSAAGTAGLEPGDTLTRINGLPIHSFADVQHALRHAGAMGKVTVAWEHGGKPRTAELTLAPGWRRTDISWRPFVAGLSPAPGVFGPDLTAEEKKSLGLSEKSLAFYQADYVPPRAHQAGIQPHDVILGIDDKTLKMTMAQFSAYIRLNYNVGDQVTLNVVRRGQRLRLSLTLPEKD
jgi:hypothetical protein